MDMFAVHLPNLNSKHSSEGKILKFACTVECYTLYLAASTIPKGTLNFHSVTTATELRAVQLAIITS